MNVHPIRGIKLLFAKQEAATQSSGGLYIPTTVDEKVVTGTVLEVGSGRVSLNVSFSTETLL